jgi:hypothetical protein
VDVKIDRQLVLAAFSGCPDVQIKTILADVVVRHELIGPRLALVDNLLNAAVSEFAGFVDTR